MKTKNLLGFGFLLAVVFASCKKEDPVATVNNNVGSTKEMVVPATFDYSTTSNLTFDVTTENSWGKEKVRLDIYDFNPTGGGSIIQSKFLEANGSLTGTMVLPDVLGKVFAVLNYPDGSSVMQSVQVQGGSVSYDFSTIKRSRKVAPTSTNCSTGCDKVINNHSGYYNVNSNDPGTVFCFTGNSTGSININKGGVTVRICGTANLNQISLNNGSYLEITDGADVTISNLYVNSNGSLTVFNADLDLPNSFSPSGPVTNYGTITIGGGYNINSNANLANYGTIEVGGRLNVSAKLDNYGTMDVESDVALNGSSVTYSSCKFLVGGKMDFNAPSTWEGYLGVTGKLTFNGGSSVTLKNGAMIEGAEAVLNSALTGTGSSVSMVKVTGNTTINGGGSLNGSLEYCDANGVETNTGSINAPAALACNAYIPTSACNPVGNGTPQIVDTDNDGVADDVDQYPNDPDASGATYYPANGQFATIAFEDLWPYAGDYDFNDLVVDYNYTMVTNASNDIVRIEAKFATKAIGAGLTNGFGVQLGCAPNAVQSVTGTLLTQNFVNVSSNGTESGQSKATVVVFDNAFKTIRNVGGTKYVNTISTEAAKTADTLDVVITFTNAISESQLGLAPYNPFLIVGGDRGKEVHLADHMPTDLADQNLFGTGADDSEPNVVFGVVQPGGKYYKSEQNHPWALNIVTGFDYPEEKNDIVSAYNFFATWAQSGGVSNLDWYVDLAGYRNSSKLY